MLVSQTAS